MASDENFVALVHYRGSIKKKTQSGIKFTDKDPLSVFLKPSTSFAEFKSTILQRLGLLGVKRVEKLFYRIPISVLRNYVKYDSFIISSDEDMQVLFHCHPSSSALPVRSSSAVPVLAPELDLVASPSFAVNLNQSCDALVGEARPLEDGDFTARSSPPCVPVIGEVAAPERVEDALQDDDDDDDVESATIAVDDSNEETPRTTPPVGGGVSSSALDLDAMAPQEDPSVPVGFGARDSQNARGMSEFQVGQQFQDKEEVVLSVKTYSICRGVEFKVLESDHRKYYGKCKEFGSGCVWLIRVSLRQRKEIWEVKRYNGPHTCLATSISSDHRNPYYHVMSAFFMPLIRADAATSIKVLQNATEAHFGFRPTYRRVWMATQKAVEQIYRDWDDSYNELPRWVWACRSLCRAV
ncbi:hypothetical protein Ahy_B09g096440 isoform A [Arachis hypogaea]|uniref:Transposase MuDR plant domain-containing protein n=1 Tax=Arachis hypogaea TaxID=3818 RepID=A0A444XKS7_ARAHY|nr:hypothetical protein Ahy_B09g096440 isoform A [Arachis hypogaea]